MAEGDSDSSSCIEQKTEQNINISIEEKDYNFINSLRKPTKESYQHRHRQHKTKYQPYPQALIPTAQQRYNTTTYAEENRRK